MFAPDALRQVVDGDDLARVDEQRCEERALLGAAERER